MAGKRKMGNGSFYIVTPELVCLFSFLTQTYNGVLQPANLNIRRFSMLNRWSVPWNPLPASILTESLNDAQALQQA